MSLADFASALFSSGLAIVSRDMLEDGEDPATQKVMADAFQQTLVELPGQALSESIYEPAAGIAGLRYLWRICRALADRSLAEKEVQDICEAMPPVPSLPEEILSLDLTLRHLPEVYRLARSISDTDPLIGGLERVAAFFPLSSVGIAPHLPPDLALLQQHAGLWQLYLDRILERQDESRLADESVRRGIRDAIGLHPFLAPKLATKLALLPV